MRTCVRVVTAGRWRPPSRAAPHETRERPGWEGRRIRDAGEGAHRMHTGAWSALPEIPWTTSDGTSFKDLGVRTEALLSAIRDRMAASVVHPVELTLLAAQAAEIAAALRDLAQSELAVDALIAFGGTRERGRRSGRHRGLRAL